jgi:hypothetical protein
MLSALRRITTADEWNLLGFDVQRCHDSGGRVKLTLRYRSVPSLLG